MDGRPERHRAQAGQVALRRGPPGRRQRRREIAGMYQKGLENISAITLPPKPVTDREFFDVFQNYVIRTQQRDKLFEYLKEKGIETLISWPKPTHHHKNLGLDAFKLPKTEELSKMVISLPLFPEIRDENVQYVIETVNEFSW